MIENDSYYFEFSISYFVETVSYETIIFKLTITFPYVGDLEWRGRKNENKRQAKKGNKGNRVTSVDFVTRLLQL